MTSFSCSARTGTLAFSLSLMLFLGLTVFAPLAGQVSEPPSGVSRVIGGQIGLLGLWSYGEFPVGSSTVVRVNAGLDAEIRGGSGRRTTIALVPVVSAGPRWYYNLKKRAAKGRQTMGNAANFLSLPVSYRPGWFTLSNVEGARYLPEISLIPTWGIRRKLGKHLNFEVGVGIGFIRRWNSDGYRNTEFNAWIPLRFGF